MHTSTLNFQQYPLRRFIAFSVGGAILAASAYAVIVAGKLDTPHAILTGAMAAGLFAGAISIGAAIAQKRWALVGTLVVALMCGELFSVATSGERIVAEREADQAKVAVLKAAHLYARDELAIARDKHNEAVREKIKKAYLPGCKDRCVALLTGNEAAAKADLDAAVQRYESNPEPKVSGSPLADRLGVPAYALDLAVAALLSIGANILAACLIGFAAHGVKIPENSGDQRPIEFKKRTVKAITEEPTLPSDADLEQLRKLIFGLNRPVTNGELAALMSCTKGEASKRVTEAVRRGVVSRKRVGREVAIEALH